MRCWFRSVVGALAAAALVWGLARSLVVEAASAEEPAADAVQAPSNEGAVGGEGAAAPESSPARASIPTRTTLGHAVSDGDGPPPPQLQRVGYQSTQESEVLASGWIPFVVAIAGGGGVVLIGMVGAGMLLRRAPPAPESAAEAPFRGEVIGVSRTPDHVARARSHPLAPPPPTVPTEYVTIQPHGTGPTTFTEEEVLRAMRREEE